MASQLKTHEGHSLIQTSLNCSSYTWHYQEGKPPESAHIHGIFGYSAARNQQNTEGASTPIFGRGAETEPKTMMHSLTATVRTLPYIAGLQFKHMVLGEPNDLIL